MPTGIIHADLFLDNALFVDEKLSGVIDFYLSATMPFIYDIAIVINDWCTDENANINNNLKEKLLSSYQNTRELTQDERSYLLTFQKKAAIRFWLLRLMNFHFPHQANNISIKDPNYFKNLIDNLENLAK